MAESLLEPRLRRRLDRLRLSVRRTLASGTRGERRSRALGSSIEFADFRPYQPGDDFRRVDWPAYARLDQLVVKQYADERDLSVHVLVDTSASMAFGTPGKLDYARRVAACVCYVALAGHDRLNLAGFADGALASACSARGRGRLPAVLDALARLEAKGGTRLEAAVDQLLAHRPRKGVAVVIGDLLDPEGVRRPLAKLRHHGHDAVVLQLLAPDEVEPDLKGDLELTDSEGGPRVDLSVNSRALARYRERLVALLAERERTCRELGAAYVLARTDTPLELLVARTLRERAILEG